MEDELQITLTNDYAFKRLLGSEENKPLLQDLLECILNLSPQDVNELELMDKELTKEELSDKTGILDVKLKLSNGTVIDIEIQTSWNASFVKRESSLFSIQALKEVTAYKIGREHLEHLIEQQEYLQIKADILEHLLIEKMQREAQFLLQSPEEIYRNLLEKDPKLIQNIPLKYIASYIGITPQALSRIRKRIF